MKEYKCCQKPSLGKQPVSCKTVMSHENKLAFLEESELITILDYINKKLLKH